MKGLRWSLPVPGGRGRWGKSLDSGATPEGFSWTFCGQQGSQGMRKMSVCLPGVSSDAPLGGWG